MEYRSISTDSQKGINAVQKLANLSLKYEKFSYIFIRSLFADYFSVLLYSLLLVGMFPWSLDFFQ